MMTRRKISMIHDGISEEDISDRIQRIVAAKHPRHIVQAIGTDKKPLNQDALPTSTDAARDDFFNLKVASEKLLRENSEVQICLDSLVLKPLKSSRFKQRFFVRKFDEFNQKMNPMNVRKAKFEHQRLKNIARNPEAKTAEPPRTPTPSRRKLNISATRREMLAKLQASRTVKKQTEEEMALAFSSSDEEAGPRKQKKTHRVSLVELMRGSSAQVSDGEGEYEYEDEEENAGRPRKRKPVEFASSDDGKDGYDYESESTEKEDSETESKEKDGQSPVRGSMERSGSDEAQSTTEEFGVFGSKAKEQMEEGEQQQNLEQENSEQEDVVEEEVEGEVGDGTTINLSRTERRAKNQRRNDEFVRSMFYDPECMIPEYFSAHDVFGKGRTPRTGENKELKWCAKDQQVLSNPYIPVVPVAELQEQDEQKIIVSRDTVAPNSKFLNKLQNKAMAASYQVTTEEAQSKNVDRLTVFLANDAIAIPISNHTTDLELADPDGIERVEKMFNPLIELEKPDVDYTIFLLPRLLPLPLFPDLKAKLEQLNPDKRDAFLRVLCEDYITSDVVPLSRTKIDSIAIYCGMLGKKKGLRKPVMRHASLYLTGELVIGDDVIQLDGLVAKLSSRKNKFTLTKKKKTKYTFRTTNPQEALTWAKNINELVQGSSHLLMDLFLFAFASPLKFSTMKETIVSALSSPDVSFVVTLLNHDKFSLTLADQVFQVFLSNKRIDYLIRCLLLSEMTTQDYNRMFTAKSLYSTSILVLFVSVAQQWITNFAQSFIENKIDTAEDMIELTMLAFGAIPPRALFIARALLLTTVIYVPSDSHPMMPFFNFVMAAIRPFVLEIDAEAKSRHHNIWTQLSDLLSSRDQFKSQFVLMLSPFMSRILNVVPVLNDCPLGGVNVDAIYGFMSSNALSLNKAFREIHDRDQCDHPLVHSYYQNLRFLMKDVCPVDV